MEDTEMMKEKRIDKVKLKGQTMSTPTSAEHRVMTDSEMMSGECGNSKNTDWSLSEEHGEIQSGSAARPNSPQPSCVSMKSDGSMPVPLNFREGSVLQDSGSAARPNSPQPSCVSMKNDGSMTPPPNFREGSVLQDSASAARPNSPQPSCVSMKSDGSMTPPPSFREGSVLQDSASAARPNSPQPSCVSMKSDGSMTPPPSFREGSVLQDSASAARPNSPQPSCVSMKSDGSMTPPPNFREGSVLQDSGSAARPNSPQPSCVSMKSDGSMTPPPNFREGSVLQDSASAARPNSPQPSCVSMKSDGSMTPPPNFREGSVLQDSASAARPNSPQPSCVSMKSDGSMTPPPNFREGSVLQDSASAARPNSPQPSCVSMKSDGSMTPPPNFREGSVLQDSASAARPNSPQPSCVSMKSDGSMTPPPNFREGSVLQDSASAARPNSPQPSCVSMKSDGSMTPPPNFREGSVLQDRLLKSPAAVEACDSLTKALRTNPLLLRELNLSKSKPEDLRIEKIWALLQDSHFRLQKLMLHQTDSKSEFSGLFSALILNPSHLRELNLNGSRPDTPGVKNLCRLLMNPDCKLEKLHLNNCSITEQGCSTLTSSLHSNPSHLRELHLSGNELGDSGVKQLSALLKHTDCKLQILRLSDCSIKEEGYTALYSALKSNPSSHLTDLDLRGNDPGDSGVKKLTEILENPKYKLNKLRLLKIPAAEEACDSLTKALRTNALLLRELDLSKSKLKYLRIEKICALLQDSHFRLQKLMLHQTDSKSEFSGLFSALILNPSHLRELNLNGSRPDTPGVKNLCRLLKNPDCKLEKLHLNNCSITEQGCSTLTSSLHSNPSHLRELHLSGNELGDSGVKQLSALLKHKDCKLQILSLNNCSITEQGCSTLTSSLHSNPSHLRELHLSGNELGDSGVKQLSALLKHKDCKLQILRLSNCSIKEEGYKVLYSALKSNPSSHLTDLDLRGNDPGDSGVKILTETLENPKYKLNKLRIRLGSESTPRKDNLQNKINDFLSNIFDDLEKKIIVFIKHELEMFKKFLKKANTRYYGEIKEEMKSLRDGVLNMTLYFLKTMDHEDLADALQSELIGIQQRALKLQLSKIYNHVCEGIAKQGESNTLNKIYTDLYITEGVTQLTKEHEARQIEKKKTRVSDTTQMQQEKPIDCKKMFEAFPEQDRPIRNVLTQGVAGIGKSICVQKFVLDWAEGSKYQDITFIFPLPFRELNLQKEKYSLMDIICHYFPETKGLRFTDKHKVMFILDGLDEYQLPLAFQENETWTSVSMPTTLDIVLTNLIRGNLLPSALIWITTRPAAAAKIPAEFIDRVTEVRGFNDEQKVEYFRKTISDENLANKIIDHIKASRSLFIMCHIPVFCWISATVLQNILEGAESEDTPKTLTDMYTYFLIFQTIQGNIKYTRKNALDIPWDKEGIMSLGKLAFQHLEKNNLIFYSVDLDECGINPIKISVYSGLCTQETGRFRDTVYSFVHLSIQEFIAAIFAFVRLINDNINGFAEHSTSQRSENETEMIHVLQAAVDKALESETGHLDLFLRFLLGLSLESNQELIRGLLKKTGSVSACRKDIINYIKEKFEQNPSPERSINLFYCLNELNDDSLVKEIQNQLKSGRLSEAKLSPAQWSALVFVLMTSEEDLDEFDLRKFIRSDECLRKLMPVVQAATTALLCECNLTERCCSALLPVLTSESSKLTKLDLSNNSIQDSGVEQLSEGLKSPNCKIEKLSLNNCSITEQGCSTLTSSLHSNPSHLRELHLSGNELGDSGVKQLSALLKHKDCKVKMLSLNNCSITEQGCSTLTSSLHSNPSHLRELHLRGNELGDSGVKQLSALLKHKDCKLQILRLSDCSIKEEGYEALASALKSNPSSHLTDLDLRGNDPGDSGVKKLTEIHKLKTLRLLKSPAAEKFCASLTDSLGSNPLLLREMDLSGKIQGDSGVEQLSDLLEDPHCRPEKLRMRNSRLTERSCSVLASALRSNPSHLRELDLSENHLRHEGITQISVLLRTSDSKLMKLILSDCSIKEEGYEALASALKSNPSSHLTDLDLRGNDPGDSGVKKLTEIQKDQKYKLEKLRLLKSPAAEKFCASLTEALGSNPLLLREMDLSGKIQGDSGVKQLSDLLEDPHCRPEKLILSNSSITERGCVDLGSALCSNLSQLKELDLSENQIGDDGVKEISNLLKNPLCKLETLKLSDCSVREKGYISLYSALTSNPSSHLTELDLRGNHPAEWGVKMLSGLPKLKLRLLKSPAAEEACVSLTESLGSNPLLLREIKLDRNTAGLSGDSRVKQLCVLLQDSNCTLEKLQINDDDLTAESCSAFAEIFSSESCNLKELDLSSNNLQDFGVRELCKGLENPGCKLKTLRLSDCSVTEEGYEALSSALKSNPSSHLTDLDLRGNDPGDSGVKKLTEILEDPNCKLEKLRLLKTPAAEEACDSLTKALRTNPLLLRELDLSKSKPKDLRIEKICALLQDSHFRLQKLALHKTGSKSEFSGLVSALILNPSHLRELNLNGSKPDTPGVENLCTLLKNPDCKLEKLHLNNCSITEQGCSTLPSSLHSNPSHLRELHLSGNELGDSGVKQLSALLKHKDCKWQILSLNNCSITEQGCSTLTSSLHSNPSHLRELHLSGNELGDSGVKQLSALLKHKDCKLQILSLNNCSITEQGCSTLTSSLHSNPSHLRELHLSGNELGDSGVKQLSALLKYKDCKLQILRLSDCSITEKGYETLASALKSNHSSHLTDLDLRGNDPGDSGVKLLTEILEDPNCKLEKLRLLSPAAEEACDSLTKALRTNALLLRELDLSKSKPKDLRIEKICALLQDSHFRLQKLTINNCSLGDAGCADLSSALCSNPSHIRELDLSYNELHHTGIKKLCPLLENQECKLEKLLLKNCSLGDRSCEALTSALRSNSHLRELDLRENTLGDSVKQLSLQLNDSGCKLIIDKSLMEMFKSFFTSLFGGKTHDPPTQHNDPGTSVDDTRYHETREMEREQRGAKPETQTTGRSQTRDTNNRKEPNQRHKPQREAKPKPGTTGTQGRGQQKGQTQDRPGKRQWQTQE
ncbi:uncharacterized protein LOC143474464 [Brachyhypopomus gauderio]|uniref:uncharacterized protein LOC143474464 n=1 Tax=Brachyhypopomus gauderio TaxID=698409 RepID=UPI00404273BF